jgi:hypothetical protein
MRADAREQEELSGEIGIEPGCADHGLHPSADDASDAALQLVLDDPVQQLSSLNELLGVSRGTQRLLGVGVPVLEDDYEHVGTGPVCGRLGRSSAAGAPPDRRHLAAHARQLVIRTRRALVRDGDSGGVGAVHVATIDRGRRARIRSGYVPPPGALPTAAACIRGRPARTLGWTPSPSFGPSADEQAHVSIADAIRLFGRWQPRRRRPHSAAAAHSEEERHQVGPLRRSPRAPDLL